MTLFEFAQRLNGENFREEEKRKEGGKRGVGTGKHSTNYIAYIIRETEIA